MDFPGAKKEYQQIPARLPVDLVKRVETEAKELKQSRNERVEYLIEYAYQAGALNTLVDKLAIQFAEISARASIDQEEVAGYDQVDRLRDQVSALDDKFQRQETQLRELIGILRGLTELITKDKKA